MSDEMAFDVDISEFIDACVQAEQEMRRADYLEVTNNAKRQLYLAVVNMPMRTGNLRSGFSKPWSKLGMPGKPMTRLSEGVKSAEYWDKRREKYVVGKFYSNGAYEDRRNSHNPMFSYAIYAAEWRGQRGRGRNSILQALRSGLLDENDAKKVNAMMWRGVSEQRVMGYIADLLTLSGNGRTWMINNGAWRPYHLYFKGNRRDVTPGEFKFTYHHRKALDKHSGK